MVDVGKALLMLLSMALAYGFVLLVIAALLRITLGKRWWRR